MYVGGEGGGEERGRARRRSLLQDARLRATPLPALMHRLASTDTGSPAKNPSRVLHDDVVGSTGIRGADRGGEWVPHDACSH